MTKKKPRKKNDPAFSVPQRSQRLRLVLIGGLFIGAYVCIAARLVWIQTDADIRLSETEESHIGTKILERERGQIVDRNGRVLATDRPAPTLNVDPGSVEDAAALARYLAPRLGISYAYAYERVTRTRENGDPMRLVRMKRHLSDAELERLGPLEESPEPKALWFEKEPVRYYPESEVASHVVGFVNQEGVGSGGIEQAWNSSLSSKAGHRVSRLTSTRRVLGFKTIAYESPSGGDRVELTIDSVLQHSLEREIDNALEDKNAPRGMGIVMDAETGAVLALAVRPGYDPNRFNEYEPQDRNITAVTEPFEPGSSFKIVTAAAALELGLIGMNDLIDCEGGRFNPYGRVIPDTHPLDIAPFYETFAQSSNIAITKVAALLGEERLEEWIRKFGFGSTTGIGLAGETAGILRPRSKWSRWSMGALPMGQEVAVTLPQLAQSFAIIANGGHRIQPHLVSRVISEEGEVKFRQDTSPGERVMSEETSRLMRELCYKVVTSEHGTGGLAAIPEYRVGGKTGTAQMADLVNGGYLKDTYTTVFAGFAPVTNPRIVCAIVVQEPDHYLHYGGHVCGPVFREVVRDALVRLNVPADPMNPGALDTALAALPEGRDADSVVQRALVEDLQPASAQRDSTKLLDDRGDPLLQGGEGLPDFAGMTRMEAKRVTVSLGLMWDPQGAGRVTRQEPAPGTPLSQVQVCRLYFARAGSSDGYRAQ